MKTYNKERIFVGLILLIPCLLHQNIVEFISAIAIWFTFQHHQVASRFQEKQEKLENRNLSIDLYVECHKNLNFYFYIKEILWVIFYISIEAYSGLIGSLIFLIYPYYRKHYKQFK